MKKVNGKGRDITDVGLIAALALYFVLITKFTDADMLSAIWIAVLNLVLACAITAALALLIAA